MVFRYTDIIFADAMIGGAVTMIKELIGKKHITKYKLAADAGIPHATLSDICSGKTNLLKCLAETVYKLAKVLDISMELLIERAMVELAREQV